VLVQPGAPGGRPGMSFFHCHLLKHEDKGMMAKVLFQ
jgi:FtsP/CotA-like multicopper oxidase with cupredoxin domain